MSIVSSAQSAMPSIAGPTVASLKSATVRVENGVFGGAGPSLVDSDTLG